ncbi:hypothetical protein [Pandoraea commovens]|uniref:Uncharacterized protein n=1 Tax=Pandoraea commovens TaxID=2508289 RepID=A0ABY5QF13_9BURK|nr:hypothetical protein [Pandoraea commovens]UVA79401.1 hypothetical protein NTU39_26030 [Pandoraea commovens]
MDREFDEATYYAEEGDKVTSLASDVVGLLKGMNDAQSDVLARAGIKRLSPCADFIGDFAYYVSVHGLRLGVRFEHAWSGQPGMQRLVGVLSFAAIEKNEFKDEPYLLMRVESTGIVAIRELDNWQEMVPGHQPDVVVYRYAKSLLRSVQRRLRVISSD